MLFLLAVKEVVGGTIYPCTRISLVVQDLHHHPRYTMMNGRINKRRLIAFKCYPTCSVSDGDGVGSCIHPGLS